MSAAQDKRYLERMNGGRWRVVVNVPQHLQGKLGCKKLKESLGTDSLVEANRLKEPVVARLKARISGERVGPSEGDIVARAWQLRSELEEAKGTDQRQQVNDDIAHEAEVLAGLPLGTDVGGNPVYDEHRDRLATRFMEIGRGKVTPLMVPVKAFLREHGGNWDGKTRGKFDKIMLDLKTWLERSGGVASVEAITKRTAGEFASAMLDAKGWKPATWNAYLSALSTYWKWMFKRAITESNPWVGQGLQQRAQRVEDRERAFTMEEMQKLIYGNPNQPYLSDIMRLAALTGARLGALVELTVGACKGGNFMVPASKHEVQSRLVPIHPDLEEMVRRRTEGKPDSDWLFPEVSPLGPDASSQSRRQNKVTKAYGYYSKKLGVRDEREGVRRSLINFHSFRRWFITEAERALNGGGADGYSETVIKEVVGHSVADITMGVYKAAATEAQRRACVEAVKLPPEAS